MQRWSPMAPMNPSPPLLPHPLTCQRILEFSVSMPALSRVSMTTWLNPATPPCPPLCKRSHMNEAKCTNLRRLHLNTKKAKNLLSSVRRLCFAAPALGAWEKLFPGRRVPGPGHSKTWASSAEDGSWSSLSTQMRHTQSSFQRWQAHAKNK